jgi:hypothetical protein
MLGHDSAGISLLVAAVNIIDEDADGGATIATTSLSPAQAHLQT